jgi:tRNA(fMet)-specific endonuclease VapC
MIFILDTDTLIFMIRGLKKASRSHPGRRRALRLLKRCRQRQKDGDVVGLSAITISELEFGARNGGRYEEEMAAVRKVLLPFEALPYDAIRAPARYGLVRYVLESAGQTIGAMDLLIAAHALSLDATLVTSNQEHFRRIDGLKLAKWD